ncbi:unnamed protein product [Calicophoron daubneyi]|uniref:Translational activator of cytochrome c oxidase 1 n=1 Tax=Calicophoron daubneyi TaxID=300641 RepID=A0AAV2TDV0_CALDB
MATALRLLRLTLSLPLPNHKIASEILPCAHLIIQPSRFAGHAHWQNVRHTKEAKDKIKSQNALSFQRAARKAVKMGGGIRDPKLNSYLASVIAQAKANSVPLAVLERVLKAEDTVDPYLVEFQAPGGLFVLIETCAKPINVERQRLLSLVKKYGFSASPGLGKIASEFFDHVGCVCVEGGSGTKCPDLDTATEIGIEIGASDVQLVTDGSTSPVYRFHCDPQEVAKLGERLESEHGIIPLSREDDYVPKCRVTLVPEVRTNLNEMYEKIRELHEYVDRIFDNTSDENSQ